uniref:Uncharacterized protein n=1 Tax=Trichuris muris TaxID=70415 RepID=A0A5S6QDB6_TRIMR
MPGHLKVRLRLLYTSLSRYVSFLTKLELSPIRATAAAGAHQWRHQDTPAGRRNLERSSGQPGWKSYLASSHSSTSSLLITSDQVCYSYTQDQRSHVLRFR